MENNFDTIVSIITPLASSAVGIIRISGDKSYEIISKLFSRNIKPKMINYGYILDENQNKIDEVIVLPFVAPHSYTAEDVIEIQTHGSLTILNKILDLCIQYGARLAQRGEFTKRAFLNKRIDLSQAEAVLDLIQSKNITSVKNALSNLGGYLKNKTEKIKNEIIEIYSKVIASIDFPEDVANVDKDYIVTICNDKIIQLNEIINNAKNYDFIKDGCCACLIGQPNVGKSSLFNALLNYNRSIVTSIEGTTRDTIKETIYIDNYMVNFIDTAGIRDKAKADIVEKIGIDNSIEAIKNSQIVIFLFEKEFSEIDEKLLEIAKNKNVLFVQTKSDLNSKCVENAIQISSKTGFGLDVLKRKILEIIKTIIVHDTNYSINKRQLSCFIRCRESLENVKRTCLDEFLFDCSDLCAIDLKGAILALDEITGAVLTDNILDNIFDNFCIGK